MFLYIPSCREQCFQTLLSLTSEKQHCLVPYWIQLYIHTYIRKHTQSPLPPIPLHWTHLLAARPTHVSVHCAVSTSGSKKKTSLALHKSAQLQLGWALRHFAYNMGVTCKQDMLHQQELHFFGSLQTLAEPSVRAPSPLKATNKGWGWCSLGQK